MIIDTNYYHRKDNCKDLQRFYDVKIFNVMLKKKESANEYTNTF